MKRLWSADELGERWSLEDVDFALLGGNPDAGKLGLVRIPIEAGQGFRREAGHYSGLKPATSPM